MNGVAPTRVALVEDDDELREATVQALMLEGFDVLWFAEAGAALEHITADFEGVVVSDIRMPRIDGLELFATLAERDAELPVILVTGHGDVPMAVEAMKRGVADFLTKPYSTAALVDAIRRAAAKRSLVIENRRLREALRDRATAGLLGTSEPVRRLEGLASQVARTDLDVHVTGESGMGKTRLARRIHELSARQDRPFVTIDMGTWTNSDVELLVFGRDRAAGLSRSGLIERAHRGTLFLDDADTIPEQVRGRLRTLLEQRTIQPAGAERPSAVDVRIIVATSNGADRLLLDHLGGVTIAIPPLRDRREDVAVIFRYFQAEFEREFETAAAPFSAEEWTFLLNHDWPGGLRELRDFARAFVLGLTRPDGEFGAARPGAGLRQMVEDFERAVLEDALRKAGGQVESVQRMLSIKRKTLYDKLARHRLKPQQFR
jgi:two-component system C4-dicarboxylate transport response regulator DctD